MVNNCTRVAVLLVLSAGPVLAAPEQSPLVTENDMRSMFRAVGEDARKRSQRFSLNDSADGFRVGVGAPIPRADPKIDKYAVAPTEPESPEPAPSQSPVAANGPQPETTAPAADGRGNNGAPGIDKYSASHKDGPRRVSGTNPRPASGASQPAYIYRPPVRNENKDAGYSFGVDAGGPHFGISRGTWVKVRLERDTNSAEPGEVSLVTTASVEGRARTLPAGTEFFGQRRYNSATDRLDVFVSSGQLPDGTEFTVNGQLFDTSKVSGFDGITKQLDIATGAATSGAVATAGAVLDSVSGSNPVTAGLGAAGGELLRQGESAASDMLSPSTVIYVSAQEGFVRLSSSF